MGNLAADRIWIGTNRGLVLFQPSAALILTIDDPIIDCHNPILQGTLTTRGQFASNNQFVFILEQLTRSDTLDRLTAHCSVSFQFPLTDLLENSFFFLRILATDPAVTTRSDTLRSTMPLPTPGSVCGNRSHATDGRLVIQQQPFLSLLEERTW